MIPATEALTLPTAQLTAEELEAANKFEAEIDEHIRTAMKYQGCVFQTKEKITETVVFAAVNRFKAVGYMVQCQPIVEKNQFNHAVQNLVGWHLVFMPTDESYRATARSALS